VSTALASPPCQHGSAAGPVPACARAADYEVRPVEAGQARTRAFCAEHAAEGIADLRRRSAASRVDYAVVALRPGLPELAFWPSDRRATLKLAIIAALILLVVLGFAAIVPILMKE